MDPTSPATGPRRSVVVAETGAWWIVLTGLWLVTAPSTGRAELVAGALAGLLCATAAPAARHAVGARWRMRARWLRALPRLVARLPAETAAVLALPWREDRSTVQTVCLGPDRTTAAGRQALAVLGLSVTPGSVVLDVHPGPDGADRILLHRVGPDRTAGNRETS